MTEFQWVIGGEAGYGIMTTGLMMAKIASRLGMSVFDYVEYPSLIRGGHNAYYVRAASEEIFSQKKPIDILVALNRQTIDVHKTELSPNAVVLYNSDSLEAKQAEFSADMKLIAIPLVTLAHEQGATNQMMNTVSVAASLALICDDFSVMETILKETFGRKGEKVVELNVTSAKAGFEYVKKHDINIGEKVTQKAKKQLLISGAEAIALGAIKAGMKFAAMYPMTPINGIMTYLVSKALEYNIVIKEPEDEISGINMAIGAGFTGVRSMVATSGGGFSLMVEGLGLAAQTETPLVIVMGMRPGPATGMPTWTEQGDLRFMIHSHQGDFPRIVIAPGDGVEAFWQTMHAFNLAEKYQLQVIVLVDKYLNEGHFTIDYDLLKTKADKYIVERGKILSDEEAASQTDYKRYSLENEDGISLRTLPGQKGGIALSGSDEHDEKGLYDETAEMRKAMMDKRFKKLEAAKKELLPPDLFGNKDAAVTIISWGTTKMPILEAMHWLEKDDIYVNFIHVSYIFPFPTESISSALKKAKKTLIIEGNHSGQFEGLIREYTGLTIDHNLRKYDGRPFYPEEIVEKVKSIK